MPERGDVARAQAEAMAAQMRGAPPAAGGGPIAGVGPEAAAIVGQLRDMFPGATVEVSGGGAADPDAIKSVEQVFGRDLDGDGVIGGSGTAPEAAAAAGGLGEGSQVAKLERRRRCTRAAP